MSRAPAVVAACLVLAAACEESIARGWLVDRTRVLGARTEAASDPSRASLEPGERGRVVWLVAAPGGALPRLGWAFAACLDPAGNFASPRCEGPALASGGGTSEGSELVAMDLETPPAAATNDARELLLLAAFCEDGAPPLLDPRAFSATCAGGGEPLLASTTVRLAAAGPNHNPVVAEDALVLPPPCVEAGGGEVTFLFRFGGGEREADESIVLSHVVTAGELDRQYSAFESADPAPKEIAIPWRPPGEEADVRVFFVLRDGRGGTTFVLRTICVRRR